MPEETENSNFDNKVPNHSSSESKKAEDKNSSTSISEGIESPLDDSQTDKAVDELTRQEGDELLALHTESVDKKSPKHWYDFAKNKKFFIPAIIVIILAVIFSLPVSRYKVLGLFLKENYKLVLTDSQTGKPVSDAQVKLAGQTVMTNNKGQAELKVKVGDTTLTITKKYYKSLSEKVLIPIHQKSQAKFLLQATGRQVQLKLVNLINGSPINNSKISADGTTATTDSQGVATLVLPAGQQTVKASISAVGYNNLSSNITVTGSVVPANTFQLTPSGRIYFLSNLSGNIDVVSANLDGSGRKTVLAGTGNEDPNNTVLLATRDWKYLALLSRRDGSKYPKLYLIDTSNNNLTTIDPAAANYNLVGWSGHDFVYETNSTSLNPWQTGQTQLKTFNADNGQLTTIDQSTGQGSQYSYTEKSIAFANLVGGRVIYGFAWSSFSGGSLSTEKNSILSVNANGTGKQDLRDIGLAGNVSYSYMYAVLHDPQTLYIQYSNDQASSSTYYEYQASNNSVTQTNTMNDQTFGQYQQNYYTYLQSPNGNQTFWSENRDGKNTLFVGDYGGNNAKQIASLSDYAPYGWYTNSYLLVEKNGSELYIMSTSGSKTIKISDYYKPPHNYYGYGGGYGGL